MNKIKRIYISGPISYHNYEERCKAFNKTQQMLEAQGYEVFNPTKNGLPPNSTTHQHMRRDLAELTREDNPYDAIFMMCGWLHSAGCKLEFDTATAIGCKVFFEETSLYVSFE